MAVMPHAKPERNTDIYVRHFFGKETLASLAKEYGISSGRAAQLYHRAHRQQQRKWQIHYAKVLIHRGVTIIDREDGRA